MVAVESLLSSAPRKLQIRERSSFGRFKTASVFVPQSDIKPIPIANPSGSYWRDVAREKRARQFSFSYPEGMEEIPTGSRPATLAEKLTVPYDRFSEPIYDVVYVPPEVYNRGFIARENTVYIIEPQLAATSKKSLTAA